MGSLVCGMTGFVAVTLESIVDGVVEDHVPSCAQKTKASRTHTSFVIDVSPGDDMEAGCT
jgi:hypothetical protein